MNMILADDNSTCVGWFRVSVVKIWHQFYLCTCNCSSEGKEKLTEKSRGSIRNGQIGHAIVYIQLIIKQQSHSNGCLQSELFYDIEALFPLLFP